MNVQTVLPPGLMADAVPGNRRGVGRAYGFAAELLRNGEAPPAELCTWLAVRLSETAKVLMEQKIEEKVKDDGENTRKLRFVVADPSKEMLRTLGVSDPGKPGMDPAGDDKRDRDQHLVWAVQSHHERDPEKKLTAIFHEVAAAWPVPRDNVTKATVADAWKRKKDFIP